MTSPPSCRRSHYRRRRNRLIGDPRSGQTGFVIEGRCVVKVWIADAF